MSILQGVMDRVLEFGGVEVTVYPHQGYGDEGDDFWRTDLDHADTGEKYVVVFEDQPSEETLSGAGFSDNAESAIWVDRDIAEEGDKIVTAQGREYLVISQSNYYMGSDFIRQVLGIRGMEG